jgi:hypothetical protein
MKFLYLFFVSFFCLNSYLPVYSIGDEQVVGRILQKLGKQINKNYNLRVIGTNVGMPGGVVELLGLEFESERILTKKEMRKILIDCTEMFLTVINSDERIRSLLKNYPFTAENIEITIYNLPVDGSDVYHPKICTSTMNKGRLGYRTVDSQNTYTYKTSTTETYSEALKIIQNSK